MQVLIFLGIFNSGYYINEEDPENSIVALALRSAAGLVETTVRGPVGANLGAKIRAIMVNIFTISIFIFYYLKPLSNP